MRLPLLALLLLTLVAPAAAQAPAAPSATPAAEPAADPEALALEGEAALARLRAVIEDDEARAALVAALAGAEAAAGGDLGPGAGPEEAEAPTVAEGLAEAAAGVAQNARAEARRLGQGLRALADWRGRLPEVGAEDRRVMAALLATILSTVAAMLILDAAAGAVARRLRPEAGARPLRRFGRAALALVAHLAALGLAWAVGWALVLLLYTEDGVPWRSQVLYLGAFLAFGLARVALRAVANPDATREPALTPLPAPVQRVAYVTLRPVAGILAQGGLFVVPLLRLWAGWAAAASARVAVATLAALAALWAIRAIARAARATPPVPVAQPDPAPDPASLAGPLPSTDPPPGLVGPPAPPPDSEAVAVPVAPPSTAPAAVAQGLGFAWRAAWPPLAVGYVIYLWLVAVTRPGWIEELALRGTVASAGAVALLVSGLHLLRRAHRARLPLPAGLRAAVPTLKPRADRILAGLATAAAAFLILAAPVLLAAGWHWIDAGALWARPGTRALAARATSAALVLLGAALLWAVVASWLDARLARSDAGREAARARTLLALFRNAFTVVVVVLAGMVALSQVGLDIAPLLAGAGVVGLAIGFGAQTLVKDIITGVFIQVEGAIDVGDVVGVAGITGGVEKLTIRSVRLRTMDGATHIIPFSSVTTVTNLTRDFGYHVAELVVGYGQSVPAVRAAMEEAFARLGRDPLARDVDGALDMQGVAEMRGDALLVRARIRTRPGRQWEVGRRYSEILKEVLDERGIIVPVASRTILVPEAAPAPASEPAGAAA